MTPHLLQARKRKLGLLEDDGEDITNLAEKVSAKEHELGQKKSGGNSTATGKIRIQDHI